MNTTEAKTDALGLTERTCEYCGYHGADVSRYWGELVCDDLEACYHRQFKARTERREREEAA